MPPTTLNSEEPVNALSQTLQCWDAVLLVRIGGVDAAGARAFLVTRWSCAWLMSPAGGVPRLCTRVYAATRARSALTCGPKT